LNKTKLFIQRKCNQASLTNEEIGKEFTRGIDYYLECFHRSKELVYRNNADVTTELADAWTKLDEMKDTTLLSVLVQNVNVNYKG